MRTNLLKTFSIIALAFAMVSCNLAPDDDKSKESLGFILEVKSEKSYTIRTDTMGLILESDSRVKLVKSDEGKRVYVKYHEYYPASGGAAAQVRVLQIGKIQYSDLDQKSLVDAMPKEKQDSIRGLSAVTHEKIWIVNGMINFQYIANSEEDNVGYSSLEYDDAASTEQLKVFRWYYTATEDAPLVPMYSTFNVGDVFGPEEVNVRIIYKDMVSQQERTLNFPHGGAIE